LFAFLLYFLFGIPGPSIDPREIDSYNIFNKFLIKVKIMIKDYFSSSSSSGGGKGKGPESGADETLLNHINNNSSRYSSDGSDSGSSGFDTPTVKSFSTNPTSPNTSLPIPSSSKIDEVPSLNKFVSSNGSNASERSDNLELFFSNKKIVEDKMIQTDIESSKFDFMYNLILSHFKSRENIGVNTNISDMTLNRIYRILHRFPRLFFKI
jgi:hypothetical protein